MASSRARVLVQIPENAGVSMRRISVIVLVAAFAGLSRPDTVRADSFVVGASAAIDLYGTGWGTDYGRFIDSSPDPAFGDLKVNLTGTVGGVLPNQSFTRDSYDWRLYLTDPVGILGEVKITSTATVHAADGTLGLSVGNTTLLTANPADAQARFPELSLFNTAKSTVSVNWSDEATLSYTKSGALPPDVRDLLGHGLVYGYLLEGSAQVQADPGFAAKSSLSVTAGLTLHSSQSPLFSRDFLDAGIYSLTPTLSATIPVDSLGGGRFGTPEYSFGLQVNVDNTGFGDFDHTMSLNSVTFIDGTTPEERGFDLEFASGMASPNITAAVPEPSSLIAGGIGALMVAGYSWRRRKPAIA
jgi:hypothetical protein